MILKNQIKLAYLSLLSGIALADTIFTSGEDINYCSSFQVKKLKDVTIAFRSTETTLTVRMNTTAKGYIGFGLSSSNMMEGTEAVIGRGPDNDVSKYQLFSYGAMRLESGKQTLMNTTFVQNEGGSFLEFTKLLEDGGVVADKHIIDGNGTNSFIWAVGRDDQLQFHKAFGSLELTLSPFCTEGVGDVEVIIVERKDYKTFYVVHGLLAFLAFALFMPIAITASRARSLFDFEFQKKKAWYVIHSKLNALAYILTVVLFALAFSATGKKGKDHFSGSHEKIGLVVMILMTLQVVAGVFRPDAHAPSKEDKSSTPKIEETSRCSSYEVESEMIPEEGKEPEVRLIRKLWQKSHILMGITTLGCGIYQLHSGATLYETLFFASNLVIVVWIALGCIFAVLAGTIGYSMRIK